EREGGGWRRARGLTGAGGARGLAPPGTAARLTRYAGEASRSPSCGSPSSALPPGRRAHAAISGTAAWAIHLITRSVDLFVGLVEGLCVLPDLATAVVVGVHLLRTSGTSRTRLDAWANCVRGISLQVAYCAGLLGPPHPP